MTPNWQNILIVSTGQATPIVLEENLCARARCPAWT